MDSLSCPNESPRSVCQLTTPHKLITTINQLFDHLQQIHPSIRCIEPCSQASVATEDLVASVQQQRSCLFCTSAFSKLKTLFDIFGNDTTYMEDLLAYLSTDLSSQLTTRSANCVIQLPQSIELSSSAENSMTKSTSDPVTGYFADSDTDLPPRTKRCACGTKKEYSCKTNSPQSPLKSYRHRPLPLANHPPTPPQSSDSDPRSIYYRWRNAFDCPKTQILSNNPDFLQATRLERQDAL